MSDDLVVGRINFLTNEPLQVSLGGTPFNKAHLDARAAEIKRLETALTEARAEIERLRIELGETRLALEQTERNAGARILELKSELSTLRARVREVVGPFGDLAQRYDPDEGDGHEHAWGRLDLTIGHLRAARQLMEEVK